MSESVPMKFVRNKIPLCLLTPEDCDWLQSHSKELSVLDEKGEWVPAKEPLRLNLVYRYNKKPGKTIEEWLEHLPNEWKEDARSAKPLLDYPSNKVVDTLEEAVLYCCDWITTKAGVGAWNTLYMAIFNGEELPPFEPFTNQIQ